MIFSNEYTLVYQ